MCGRYTLRSPRGHDWLRGAPELEAEVARYNIAPSQRVPVVGRNAEQQRVAGLAVWGFHPRWLPEDGRSPINARAETAHEKPMFRGAFRRGRCLLPADGWYEWRAQGQGPKQPFFFHRPDDSVFWFAGLAATDAAGERTVAILTTDANALAREIHPRMPVVLAEDRSALAWLDPEAAEADLRALLRPAAEDIVSAHPVSRRVNKPQNDDPECVEPVQD